MPTRTARITLATYSTRADVGKAPRTVRRATRETTDRDTIETILPSRGASAPLWIDEESRPDADAFLEMTRKLSVFLGDRFLVTIHRRRLPFLDAITARARAEDLVYLQVLMLEILLGGVETLHEPLEQAELEVHDFEASLLEGGRLGVVPTSWMDPLIRR
jgi:Mg2+ and Co2+ transporter CorA